MGKNAYIYFTQGRHRVERFGELVPAIELFRIDKDFNGKVFEEFGSREG